jgi:hypothetical protein
VVKSLFKIFRCFRVSFFVIDFPPFTVFHCSLVLMCYPVDGIEVI